MKFGMFAGEDNYTTKESERLIRLPLYYGIKPEEIESVIDTIVEYYC
jgi:dTDP-4-amino-4,6-dideoxygalactose transaminase